MIAVTDAMAEAGKEQLARRLIGLVGGIDYSSVASAIYLAMEAAAPRCPTCGFTENELCSDGYHAPGETYWPEAAKPSIDAGEDDTEMCDACDGSGFGVADTYCGKCDGAGGCPRTSNPETLPSFTEDDVGRVAEIIHDAMYWAASQGKGKPQPWQNGNSTAEAKARRAARAVLATVKGRSQDDLGEALRKAAPAIEQLRNHQQQLDADGTMVGVSRQAIDETLAAIDAALDTNQPNRGEG